MPALAALSLPTIPTSINADRAPTAPLGTGADARASPASPLRGAADAAPLADAAARAAVGTDAAARATPGAAIGGRVPASPSFLSTRLAALSSDTRTSLLTQRARYAEIIAVHEATIGTLETELAQINARIATKDGQLQSLLSQKQRLTSRIAENRRMAGVAAVYGGLVGIFTMGIGTAVGAGIAATAGAALIKLQADLSDANRQESAARAEVAKHQAERQRHDKLQGTLRARVDGLRTERDALATMEVDTTTMAPAEAIRALEAGVLRDQRTIGNLEDQIKFLRAMKGQSLEFEAVLDRSIAQLEKDVAQLTEQYEASRRALFEAVLDITLAAFGATLALRGGALDPTRKAALLAGFDVAHGRAAEAVTKLIGTLASEAIIVSAGSAVLAHTLGAALSSAAGPPRDWATEVRALVNAAAGALSPVHRGLLKLLEAVTAFDPRPLAQAVIDAPKLDAAQAELIAKLLAQPA